jgi:hypothetical protein
MIERDSCTYESGIALVVVEWVQMQITNLLECSSVL